MENKSNRKTFSKKILVILEYVIFLIIPMTIFFYITIQNKNSLELISKQKKEQHKNEQLENSLINKGLHFINQKKYKESIEVNLEVLTINSNNKFAYNNIGIAYANMQLWDKGIEYCSKALSIDPNFQLAKNNINWMKSEKEKQTP
ncbi:hypothetical protein ATO12_18145 [Aquimarina atlantica]|uniref:Uncharacterized protein n=1 Tax=Aquimarina atlantica TaxID=1317122 RepID=A0A023BSH1_9FLAO|nr:tetratricopeptide repeat protein [Aquimarina atlantica]EZH72942.1 hypothetical protein ATO12_18145 [Aquimarina atlantica]